MLPEKKENLDYWRVGLHGHVDVHVRVYISSRLLRYTYIGEPGCLTNASLQWQLKQ